MKNRVGLVKGHLRFLQDIIDKKKEPRKTDLMSDIGVLKLRYKEYNLQFKNNSLELLKTVDYTKNRHDNFRHCYDVETAALGLLIKRIYSKQSVVIRRLCPYCALAPTQEIDHYLPAELFPDFSVLAINLIPCCGTCNKKKGKRWLVAGKRIFLNFYLDVIPDIELLDVSITWKKSNNEIFPIAEFSLKPRPLSVSVELYRILKSHFEKLDLLAKYADESPAVFFSLYNISKSMQPIDDADLFGRLMSFIDFEETKFGVAHWKIALQRKLAKNRKFRERVLYNET